MVIHPFSDSDTDAEPDNDTAFPQDYINTDYDSDFNEGEDLLDDDLDPVFQ